MCVIAIYNNGKRPTKDDVKKMMAHNPDGAGIAWNNGKEITFIKGFDDAKTVMRIVRCIPEDAQTIVFHARIATSGGISAEKCHPFIVAETHKALNTTKGRGTVPILFHNGIFSIDVEAGLNDTQTLIKEVVAPLHKIAGARLKSGSFDKLLKTAYGSSRVVLMYPDCIKTYGTWSERDGVQYSNLNHFPTNFNNYNRYYNNYNHYYGGWEDAWDDWSDKTKPTANNKPKAKPLAEKRWINGNWHINNYKVERKFDGVLYYDYVCELLDKANTLGIPPFKLACETVNGKPIKWDGKETEAEYNSRVNRLKNAKTDSDKDFSLLKVKGVEIPRYYYENKASYVSRVDYYKTKAERGIAPMLNEVLKVGNTCYMWDGKSTTHEFIRQVLAMANGYKYKPLSTPLARLIYDTTTHEYSVNDIKIERFNYEDFTTYEARVTSYVNMANFAGTHYTSIAYANGFPVLWDGDSIYMEYYDKAKELKSTSYPLTSKKALPVTTYENNYGIAEEVNA